MSDRKGYRQFCPVAKAAEVLAERWTFLIVRELLAGSQRFNDMRRGVPMMSPSLLSQRLKELERAKIIERHADKGQKNTEYTLTQAGEELRPIIEQMGAWGLRWTHNKVARDELDPGLLMWDIRRGVQVEHLPPGRTVVEFDFGASYKKKRLWWLVVNGEDVELCPRYPGFDVDATVTANLRALVDVWLGKMNLKDALRSEKVQIDGPTKIVKPFPKWLGLSGLARASEQSRM